MQSFGIEKERTPTVAQVRALLPLLQEPVSFFLHGFKVAKCKSSSYSLTYLFFKVWMPPLLHVPELVKKAELCSCR
jgi:hypothetical protein